MKINNFFLIIFSTLLTSSTPFEKGEILFEKYCFQCHINGNTILFPEKNLKKESLERNGMNSIESIAYQVKNGKNGMPAFGGKLTNEEIKQVALYILEKSQKNFQ